MRVNLTDRRIAALQPDLTGRLRPELRDSLVPGLIVRAAAKRKTFMLHCRFPGAKHPTRRAIGEVGSITLDAARNVARDWLMQVKHGVDPAAAARQRIDAARRDREQQRLRQENLFAAVAEDYLKRKVAGQRQARAVGRVIRNVLVPALGDKPLTEITRRDVVRLVETIDDRGAPVQAAWAFAHLRALLNWAINRGSYGLEHSPCDRVRIADLVSRTKQPRQRTLSDDELLAFWKATGRMPYPFGPWLRLLLLTGTRRSEAAGARWREIDAGRRLWVIPPERFKSGVSHLVPLTDRLAALIEALPRFKHGDCLFSFSFGAQPIGKSSVGKPKKRLDALMLRYLKALARLRGQDPTTVTLAPFVIHDLRRTVRTKLAALDVNDSVAELLIGHSKRGLQRVYDQHRYEPQLRRALDAWGAELERIVTPPPTTPANVVSLRTA